MQAERYRRIVLATDGSTDAAAAVAALASFAWPDGTAVAVVGVCTAAVSPRGDRLPDTGVEQDARRYLEMVRQDELERTREIVAAAAARLRQRRPGLVVEEEVRSGEPAAEILAAAADRAADLLVAGARGHTAFRGLLLGSVSEALANDAACPVLIVRDELNAATSLGVLVGIGADDDAARLGDAVLRLPLPSGASAVAASVAAALGGGPLADDPERRRLATTARDWTVAADGAARAAAERLAERLRAGLPEATVETRILAGEVAAELLAIAAEIAADLIVVGARERRGMLARLGLGSVSRKLVRRAGCSVLVVRGGRGGGAEGRGDGETGRRADGQTGRREDGEK